MSHLVLHTDGGSRGNPGPAAIGIVIEVAKAGKTAQIGEIGETIGVASNNVAEYRAIIRGLEEAERLGASTVTCVLDSLLVVEQLNGNYRVKSEDMKPLHARVRELRRHFASVAFRHVRREQNQEADRLVNAALDGKAIGGSSAGALPQLGIVARAAATSAARATAADTSAAKAMDIVQRSPGLDWTPLVGPGVRGVEGKVLVRTEDLTVAMLKFDKDASIDEHSADGDGYVICIEGQGHVSVGSTQATFSAGDWSRWPAGVDHRLWTSHSTMVTLTVETERARGVRRRGRG